MKRNLLLLITLLITLSSHSQYHDPIYGNPEPENPTIDSKKIKFRLSKTLPRFFSIGNISGNPNICKEIEMRNYKKNFPEEVYKTIGLAIKKNIPPINSSSFIDVDIRDFRFVRHQLFSDNYLIELSMDFFLRNDTVSKKVYSASQALFLISTPKIERILAKLIKRTFECFIIDEPYIVEIPYFSNKTNSVLPDTFPKGIYTSHDDIKNKKPSILLTGNIVYIGEKDFQRYSLKNQKFNTNDLNDNILGFSDGQDLYFNANRFYPNNYFIKLEKITPSLYYSYDGISDTKNRASAMAATGGGLLGALIMEGIGGTESMSQTGISGSQKCHLIIDIQSGSMIALTKRRIKNLLKDQKNEFKRYQKIRALKDNKMMKSYIEMLINKELISLKF